MVWICTEMLPHISTLQAADRSKEVEVLKKRQAVEEGEMKVWMEEGWEKV